MSRSMTEILQDSLDQFDLISKYSKDWSAAIPLTSGEEDKSKRTFKWSLVPVEGTRHGYNFALCMSADRLQYVPTKDNKFTTEYRHIESVYLFTITLQPYPYCCAMWQANGFLYKHLTEDQVHEALDYITKLVYEKTNADSRRLVFNFVENFYANKRIEKFTGVIRSQRQLAKLPPLEQEPTINYPFVHTWAKKQARYDAIENFNVNTHNIIHTAFVVPNHYSGQ